MIQPEHECYLLDDHQTVMTKWQKHLIDACYERGLNHKTNFAAGIDKKRFVIDNHYVDLLPSGTILVSDSEFYVKTRRGYEHKFEPGFRYSLV